MKSKEALDNWYNTESPNTKAYEYEQHYRLIKKDLEVLEILKDKLDIALYEDEKNNMYIMMLRFPKYYHNELIKISKKEHELLKERLENERN